jgi:hypothetical protein
LALVDADIARQARCEFRFGDADQPARLRIEPAEFVKLGMFPVDPYHFVPLS